MRHLLLILTNVLPLFVLGQYTYFNNGYPPPHPEVGSGFATNILLKNDTLITYNVSPHIGGIERNHYYVDQEGNIVNQINHDLPNNGFLFGQYADAVMMTNNNFVFATGYYDNQYPNTRGRIIGYDNQFEELWHYSLDYYQADSIQSVEFGCVCELMDGGYMAAGWIAIDSIEDVNPWPTHCNFLLTKITANGDSVWQHEYPFHLDEYFNLPQNFMRSNAIKELPNGDILVWGAWYDQADPFVIKFDSQGHFIDEVHWGHATYSDWLPLPVQISDHEFMFAYTNAVSLYQNFLVVANIKIGILDTDNMTLDWVGTYDYQHDAGGVVDFEKTPDGGYVVLGFGGDASVEEFLGEAYMLKIDALGNEEWYHTYQPPVNNYFSPQTYDLEVAADGSLIFLGNYEDADAGYYSTWLVKTDACGDEVYSGCPLDIHENPRTATATTLRVYPNPAQEMITLDCNQPLQCVSIRNALGEIVQTFKLPNNSFNHQIDTSHLNAGIYLLEAKSMNGQIVATKLIVE